ncbi:MAG: sugar ABC transporter permease [Gorillibacterium sp.]|nr:sugar ABC transporter permease [Gorillibacterium sp.]
MMNLSYRTQKKLVILTFIFVPLALLVLFSFYPAVNLVYLSFTSWDGFSPGKTMVGFSNYQEIFADAEIFKVFAHNFAYFASGILQNVVAIYFAIVLNGKLRGRNYFRVMLFLPYIMNGVAVAYMFSYVFDTTNGSLNHFLGFLGLPTDTSWLGITSLVNYSLASISLWRFFGFNMVIYLSALQAIPSDIYEAASIDGASGFQTFWRITLPNIRKVIELNMFLTVTGALEVFDLPFVLTGGGPAGASETFVQKIVATAFQFNNYGLASAMSVILIVIVIIVIMLQRLILNRKGDTE